MGILQWYQGEPLLLRLCCFKQGFNFIDWFIFPLHIHTHGQRLTEQVSWSSISAWHPRTVMFSFELMAEGIFQWLMAFAPLAVLLLFLTPSTSLSLFYPSLSRQLLPSLYILFSFLKATIYVGRESEIWRVIIDTVWKKEKKKQPR